MQDGLNPFLADPPYDSDAGGAAPLGGAVKIPLCIHSRSSEGIAPVSGSAGEAVQQGQPAARTQLIHYSLATRAAVLGDPIQVALPVHEQICERGICAVGRSPGEAVQHRLL